MYLLDQGHLLRADTRFAATDAAIHLALPDLLPFPLHCRLGHNTAHFNVGNYRRLQKEANEVQDASFFDSHNKVSLQQLQESVTSCRNAVWRCSMQMQRIAALCCRPVFFYLHNKVSLQHMQDHTLPVGSHRSSATSSCASSLCLWSCSSVLSYFHEIEPTSFKAIE